MLLPIPTVSLESAGIWLTLIGLGAYHGLNPAMGWLFAVALGIQQNNSRAVWQALVPIALGHAASVALAAIAILMLQTFISMSSLQLLMASMLIVFGIYKLINWYRHPRWVGMRVNWRELTGWSFLMATAHGAGLMIAPSLIALMSMQSSHDVHAMHAGHASMGVNSAAGLDIGLAVSAHTLSMFVTMALIAWVVYRKVGLMVLKKGWLNFDLIWAVALIFVGVITLIASLSQIT
jgi:hypothetical protein